MKYCFAFASVCLLLITVGCTQSPEKLLASANKYHDKKKYREASILYQKVLTKDKTNAEAYYREGLNLLDEHSPGEAVRFLRRAVDLNPNNSDAEVKLAEIYLAAYSSDPARTKTVLVDARALTAKILQGNPNSFDGIRLQALIDLADKNPEKALANFERANQIKPNSREVAGWYAQSLIMANRAPEAEALIRTTVAKDKTWGPGYDLLFMMYNRQHDADKAIAVLRERVANDPSNAVAISNLASQLLATNHSDEAEKVIAKVLADKTSFPSGREMVGDFYVRAKKYDQALQQYEAGKSESSKDAVQYNQRIVAVDAMMGRRDDALKLAKTVVDKNPTDVPMNDMYASLLLGGGRGTNFTKAVDELKSLVQKNPNDAVLHLDLARAYVGLNDADKSTAEALKAIDSETKSQHQRPAVVLPARLLVARLYEGGGQYAKALDQTNMVLTGEPNNPEARVIRDGALIRLNEADRAQPDLEALVKQYPQANDAHLELAGLYLNQRQYDKASEQFDRAWKSNPPDNRGLVGLQQVKLAQGKGEEAISTLQGLVQQNPTTAGYRFQLANLQSGQGTQVLQSDPARGKVLLQQAEDNYRQVLKTASSPELWVRLGTLQRQLGQNDAALGSFEQAATADPRNAAAFLDQGMLLESLNRKKEAADAYNKVLGIDPENALALNNLAFLSAETGSNLDQAMTFAERAKKKVPDSPDVSDTLGFVYYQKNLNTEAVRIFRQVVQERPQNATFHLHLAMALLKQGDKQGARLEADKAMKNAKPDEQVRIRTFVNQIG